jgi:hypothetical protein
MPNNLQKRRRRWYAVLEIPPSMRAQMGKIRFIKSLETESRTEAGRKSTPSWPVGSVNWIAPALVVSDLIPPTSAGCCGQPSPRNSAPACWSTSKPPHGRSAG